MSIGSTVHSQANEEDFERFCTKHERLAKAIATRKARYSLLGKDAAEDIWFLARYMLWRDYWRPDVENRYEFFSNANDRKLVKCVVEMAFNDLLCRFTIWLHRDFERFCTKHDQLSRRLAERASRPSLGIEAEDIWLYAVENWWLSYWQPKAKSRYQFFSEAADRSFVAQGIKNAFLDLEGRAKKDRDRLESLDAPIAWGDSTITLYDLIAAWGNVCDEAIANIEVEAAFNQKLGKTNADGIVHIICHLFGERSLEDLSKDLSGYSEGYVPTNLHRLKEHLLHYLHNRDRW